MHRREYLASVAAAAGPMLLGARTRTAPERDEDLRIFASPAKARESLPEKLAYIVALYAGTEIRKPDYLATHRRRSGVGDLLAGGIEGA